MAAAVDNTPAATLWQEHEQNWAGLQQKLRGPTGAWPDWVKDVPGTSGELVPVRLAERIKQLPPPDMRLPPQPLDPRAWHSIELQPSRDQESAPAPAPAAQNGTQYDPFHIAPPEPASKSARVLALAQEVYRLRPAQILKSNWLEDPGTIAARVLAKQLVPHVATFQTWRTWQAVHAAGPEVGAALDALVAALQAFDQSRKRKAGQL